MKMQTKLSCEISLKNWRFEDVKTKFFVGVSLKIVRWKFGNEFLLRDLPNLKVEVWKNEALVRDVPEKLKV